jgi:type IV pilus assembly protein PilV
MRPAMHVCRSRAAGFSLIEVLVSILIVTVGLLGLAGLQARAQIAEFESYQRAQALVMLYDMVERLGGNRITARCFAITTNTASGAPYFGDPANPVSPSCGADTAANNAMAVAAMSAWDGQLQGISEKKGAGATKVGSIVGARGCVSYNPATEYINATSGANINDTGEYTIAVSWQGMADTFAPVAACGSGLYGSEAKRRTVWVTMRIATLRTM